LKNSPIGRVRHITREEFDNVFDCGDTVVWEASAFLRIGKAVVFTLEVPFFEPFRNITTVKLKGIGLSRARHDIEGMKLGRRSDMCHWIGDRAAIGRSHRCMRTVVVVVVMCLTREVLRLKLRLRTEGVRLLSVLLMFEGVRLL